VDKHPLFEINGNALSVNVVSHWPHSLLRQTPLKPRHDH
jgi:hypothetical protein